MELTTELQAPQVHTSDERGDGRAVSDDFTVDTADGNDHDRPAAHDPGDHQGPESEEFWRLSCPCGAQQPIRPRAEGFRRAVWDRVGAWIRRHVARWGAVRGDN